MLVKDFITKEVLVLKDYDTVEYALNMMDELKVKQLPLVTGEGLYQGLVEEKALLEVPLLTIPLADASRRNRLGLRYETCAEGNGDDAGLPSTPHRFVGRNDNEDHHFRGQSHRSFAACDRLPALFPPQAEIG